MKATLSRTCLAVLPLILAACGNGRLATSKTESCGNNEAMTLADGEPSTDWAGAFAGSFEEHKIDINLATDGRHATLSVDGGQAIDLGLVARLYCSDSLGMFGDGPTRAESKTLISLFRTPANERTIKINRWGL